jgi:hypothetical protein
MLLTVDQSAVEIQRYEECEDSVQCVVGRSIVAVEGTVRHPHHVIRNAINVGR